MHRELDGVRRLLIVDDDPDSVRLIVGLLRDEPIRLLWATSAHAALELARMHSPNAILLSWTLLEMSGSELADLLALDPATARIPIVLLSLEPWLFSERSRYRVAQVVNRNYICDELVPRVRDALGLPQPSDTPSEEVFRLRDRSLWWRREEADWRPHLRRSIRDTIPLYRLVSR